MKERLQKIMSAAGIASRRSSEEMIAEGRVYVNGVVASLGDSADLDIDEITVDGRIIDRKKDKNTYIMLNKPIGVVTTMSDERGRKTVRDLTADVGKRVYPVGRLDINSSGLLLMIDDGELTNRLTHPKHEVEKEYIVRVKGALEEAVKSLSGEIELDGVLLKPAKVKMIRRDEEEATISIVIHEGKNRQVRKMCAACSLKVISLVRVRVGEILLGSLPKGKWRYLTESEINSIKNTI
ncbi:MAG: rRNA pseudouridine synthase [Clostridiales bacterium]|nr:rRNA pseudouridine synthase [Clostridiales bacterium]